MAWAGVNIACNTLPCNSVPLGLPPLAVSRSEEDQILLPAANSWWWSRNRDSLAGEARARVVGDQQPAGRKPLPARAVASKFATKECSRLLVVREPTAAPDGAAVTPRSLQPRGELAETLQERLAQTQQLAETRKRQVQCASIAAVVLLLATGMAVWQWQAATKATVVAQAQTREAQKHLAQAQTRELLRLMGLAAEQVTAGDPVTALLLAREGMPGRFTPEQPDRPVVASFWPVLHDALAAQREILVLRGHEAEVTSAEFSADGTRIVTGSYDGTTRVWLADGSGEPLVLLGHEGSVISAGFSPDGTRIVSASGDNTARVWMADGSGEPLVLLGHEAEVGSAGFSPDGTRIVTASDDSTARVWMADGSGAPVVLRGHENVVWSAGFSPDGTRIVTASEDSTARVWLADGSGEPVVLRGHENGVWSAGFSPDGTRIVTASWDGTARVWLADGSGAAPGPARPRGRGHLGRVQPRRDPNRHRLGRQDGAGVAGRRQRRSPWSCAATRPRSPRPGSAPTGPESSPPPMTARRGCGWPTAAAQPLVLRGHENGVWSAGFSPDGTRIVTASADKTARVWMADGSGAPVVLRGHENRVTSAGFSPDGTRIVTASGDNTARVWMADGSGEPVVLRGHENGVWSAGFSPDGTRIVTASADKTARVWMADGSGEPLVLRGHEGRCRLGRVQPGRDQDRHRLLGRDGTGVDGRRQRRTHGPARPRERGLVGRVQPRRDQDRHRLGR